MLTSLVIKEMQMKTTVKYHYTLFRMTLKSKTGNIKYWCEFEATDAHIFLVGIQNDTAALNDNVTHPVPFPSPLFAQSPWIIWDVYFILWVTAQYYHLFCSSNSKSGYGSSFKLAPVCFLHAPLFYFCFWSLPSLLAPQKLPTFPRKIET